MTEQPKIQREDRASIRLLGRLLGKVIREQHGLAAFQLVEECAANPWASIVPVF